MSIEFINTPADHDAVVERMEALLEVEGDEADTELVQLCALLERYETTNVAAA